MQACIKCGKQTMKGNEYCEKCREAADERQIEQLMAVAELERYRPPRRVRGRWLVLSMLAVAAILLATAAGLVVSVPTDSDFRERAQASVCRSNIRRVQRAVERYYEANGSQTPPGRVSGSHPLLTDQYMSEPPRCPTTKRYYVIVESEAGLRVICDSDISGHAL